MNLKPAHKTLFLEALSRNAYGDGPAFATVQITDAFIKRLQSLKAHADAIPLYRAIVEDNDSVWDCAEEYHLVDYVLVLCPDGFFWSAVAKHADFVVETREMSIEALVQFFQSEAMTHVHCHPGNQADLQKLVRESLELEVDRNVDADPATLDTSGNLDDDVKAIEHLCAILDAAEQPFATPDCPECLCTPSKPPAGASAL